MNNYANMYLYTDIVPHEIIKRISDKTIEVRRMKTTMDPNFEPEFIAGGFVAHCTNNNEQRWLYESDETQPIFRIRWSKTNGRWQDKGGSGFSLEEKPRKKYDYNF